MEHIDTQSALALLGGSKKLYVKLLTSFYKKYKDMAGSLEDMAALGDFEEARRLAHSIKGLCGNLGASRLQELSKALEYAYRDRDSIYVDILPEFYDELDIIMDEIPKMITSMGGSLTEEEPTSPKENMDNGSYKLLLNKLHEALSKFKYSDVKTVTDSIQSFEVPREYENQMPKVLDAIKHFDYKEAADLVEGLLKQ